MGHDDWRPAAILIGVGVLAAAAAGAMQLLATRDDERRPRLPLMFGPAAAARLVSAGAPPRT
jgi:muramidase (phage lysozyme)